LFTQCSLSLITGNVGKQMIRSNNFHYITVQTIQLAVVMCY